MATAQVEIGGKFLSKQLLRQQLSHFFLSHQVPWNPIIGPVSQSPTFCESGILQTDANIKFEFVVKISTFQNLVQQGSLRSDMRK